MIPSTMPNIRKAIEAEMKRREWTVYRLAQEVKGKVSPDTVYKFLAGTRSITHTFLEPILEALGLEVRRKR